VRVRTEDLPVILRMIRREYREKVFRCIVCHRPLQLIISMYPHGDPEYWWLYIHCPRCGYDNALWKLVHRTKRGVRVKWNT